MEKLTLDIPLILPDIPDLEDKCISRLIGTLEGRDGVDRVHIKTDQKKEPKLCIHFDPETISLNKIKTIAQQTGAKLHDIFGHILVKSNGIRHSRHARSITRRLREVEGVVDAYASATGWIRVEYKKDVINSKKLSEILTETGLDIQQFSNEFRSIQKETKETDGEEKKPVSDHEGHKHDHPHKEGESHDHDHDHGKIFGEKTELIFSLICGGLLALGFGLSFIDTVPSWVSLALYVGAYFFGGFYLVQEAYSEVKAGNFEIDFLMIIAAIGAAILGEWAEGALLLFLFSLGHALEHFAMGRARQAIKALAELAPKTALRNQNGKTEEVPVDELSAGDVIIVKPNSKISADGIIISGNSSIDQSPITGESVPVDKMEYKDHEQIQKNPSTIDDKHRVFAGTINGSGSIEVMVTKLAKDSTLSRLVTLVNEAETHKSPTQQFTDKFERYFVPSVLVLVVLLHFAFLVVDEAFSASFYRAMAVLVAASPCALAISTPSAVLSGVARAARGGVLIKGGRPLEDLGVLRALAFDKTGTLTEGKPKLVDVVPMEGVSEDELLAVAVAVESLSDHPLADAVVRGSKERMNESVEIPKAEDLESVTGRGVKAKVNGAVVNIGNRDLFEFAGGASMSDELQQQVVNLEGAGKTTMIVRCDDRYLGILSLMDTPRKDAVDVIRQLREIGLTHLIMLTGDNQKVADAVAKELDIDDPKGSLLPEEKVESIKKIRDSGNEVAMVGDGVNDAPAMANSTVGIAMGAAGSDVALETADVALMADKLSALPFAIGLSRKTKTIIKQNLWMSLGMVVVLIPATIFGLNIGPAVMAHEGSTLIVVFNALRLLRYKS